MTIRPAEDLNGKKLPTYQELLSHDRQIPAGDMLECFDADLGVAPLSNERYTSVEFHRLEVDRMWRRVWQLACREEEIPEVGDVVVYDIAEMSLLVVRSAPDEIRAFHNSCLHRGTKLCMSDTSVARFRCPYHGFTWALDGRLDEVPARWDFPQIDDNRHRLPEAKVGIWEGFVFVNMDPECEPLESYLEDLPQQLSAMKYEDHFIAGHYSKVMPCNWKLAIEAFIEAYHVAETHSHTAKMSDEVCTQYDILPGRKHFNRNFQPMGIPCANLEPRPSEQEVLDEYFRLTRGIKAPQLPDGISARAFAAQKVREELTERTGYDYSHFSDAETLDNLQYSLFPNIVMFRTLSIPIVYRSRPYKNDPDRCIFEMYILSRVPKGQERPEAAAVTDMGERSFMEMEEFPDFFAELYDQDVSNLRAQQEGLHASVTGQVELSKYQEVRIRHLHETLDFYLGNADNG